MKMITTVVLVLSTVGVPARAQSLEDRWTPWLGCWQMLDDRLNEAPQVPSSSPATDEVRSRAQDVTVCVTRGPNPASVVMTTRVAGQEALAQTVVADGVAHPVNESDCRGTQRADWSRDGRRLFASAEISCRDQTRRVSGLTLLEDSRTWLDIQGIEIDNRTEVRLRRYRRDDSQVGRVRSLDPAGRDWTVADVIEANGQLSIAVIEAALIEARAHFTLNSRALVALDRAGVPPDLIDVMVALSYPEKFVVEPRAQPDRGATFVYDSLDADTPWGPWFYSPYFSRAYFAPFGYYFAPYPAYWYSGSPSFIVDGGGSPAPEVGEGRVINGLGYTRVRPRQADERATAGTHQSGSSPRGRAVMSSSGATQSSGSSSGSSGSDGSSSKGSGGSSSDGGRTAQPR